MNKKCNGPKFKNKKKSRSNRASPVPRSKATEIKSPDLDKERNLLQGLTALAGMGNLIKRKEEKPVFSHTAQNINKQIASSPQPKSLKNQNYANAGANLFSQSLNL